MTKAKTTKAKNSQKNAEINSPNAEACIIGFFSQNSRVENVILAIILIILAFFISYHLYFAQKIIPGVYIGSVALGGLDQNNAKIQLQQYIDNSNQTITFTYNDQRFKFNNSDLGLQYDVGLTVQKAFEIGRTGNFFIDNKNKLAGLFKQLNLNFIYYYDEDALNNSLLAIQGSINKAPLNARFVLDDQNELLEEPEIMGIKVAQEDLYQQFISSFNSARFTTNVIKVQDDKPEVYTSDLAPFKDQIKSIISTPFTIEGEDDVWTLDQQDLLNLVRIASKVSQESNQSFKPYLTINTPEFEAYIDNIAFEINKLPKATVEADENGKVTKFEIVEQGETLDVKQLEKDFKSAVLQNPIINRNIKLVTKQIDKDISKEDYGIIELLGVGESYFLGSASGRIHNLSLAAERTSGVLVPPGSTYSFNKSVGYISSSTGYTTAYIISGGRTVLGDGGGVCQTSTTLFRAVLNAGLPVVERHPHAYRVSYYEQQSPVGIDASIYQPSLDLKFKNDTQHYILVQSEAFLEDSKLVFELFGTSDGRKVEITEPIITKQIAPPTALYQDDPTLSKGVVKQIDFAAWGATTSFDRIVTRGDETLQEDTFITNYQPWQAVFLVGTK